MYILLSTLKWFQNQAGKNQKETFLYIVNRPYKDIMVNILKSEKKFDQQTFMTLISKQGKSDR